MRRLFFVALRPSLEVVFSFFGAFPVFFFFLKGIWARRPEGRPGSISGLRPPTGPPCGVPALRVTIPRASLRTLSRRSALVESAPGDRGRLTSFGRQAAKGRGRSTHSPFAPPTRFCTPWHAALSPRLCSLAPAPTTGESVPLGRQPPNVLRTPSGKK